MRKACFHFLYVDDDEADAFFFTRALKNVSEEVVPHWVSSGQIAVEYLLDGSNPPPHLIICDVNMPGMNGLEFLKWIRASPFRRIPVVMLSGSTLPVDVDAAFELGANAYIGKPVSTSERMTVVERMVAFWCQTSALPSPESNLSFSEPAQWNVPAGEPRASQ